MSKKRSAGAERLRRARKAASKELRLPLGSWQTRRYGLLMVAHDNITTRLANGGDVSIADLLRIDDAMAAIRASLPPEPVGVTIEIVDSLPQLPSPDPPSTPPPTPPSPPSSPPPTETSPAPSAPAASNVVPIKRAESNAAVSETMRAWNRLQGYSVAPDGKLGRSRGAPVIW
ncbi:MAG: hypothetical protein WAM72_20825 [Xanthobacteraceae bacterium]